MKSLPNKPKVFCQKFVDPQFSLLYIEPTQEGVLINDRIVSEWG